MGAAPGIGGDGEGGHIPAVSGAVLLTLHPFKTALTSAQNPKTPNCKKFK